MRVFVLLLAGLLLVYGLVGSADMESAADLTAGVNRAEVMAWAR